MSADNSWKGAVARGFTPGRQRIILYALLAWLVVSVAYIIGSNVAQLHTTPPPAAGPSGTAGSSYSISLGTLENSVIPSQGFVIDAKWGTAIKQLIAANALNASFIYSSLAQSNQPITPMEQEILNGTYEGNIVINQSNSAFMLYVLWALGINNNNPIVNKGPIMTYGGSPYNLASTGGYGPLGQLQLGKLSIINLTPAQQAIANYTAENTYRPCCNNPTFFPDCNHGAAALGLVELMASQGASAQEIFAAVEHFNVLQFPQQYLYAAAYFSSRNINWADVAPQVVMGYNYSSASGSAATMQYLKSNNLLPSLSSGSSSCGA